MHEQEDQTDWAILDAVSDDPEAQSSIAAHLDYLQLPHEPSELLARLTRLLQTGCLELHDTDPAFYGLTATGCELWERLDRIYSPDEPLDWSRTWVLFVDPVRGVGTITGTTRSVCESVLARQSALQGWEIEPGSMTHRPVEGFQAKYYKWLPEVHQISFAVRPRTV